MNLYPHFDFHRVDRGDFDALLQIQQNVTVTQDDELIDTPELKHAKSTKTAKTMTENTAIIIDDSPPGIERNFKSPH